MRIIIMTTQLNTKTANKIAELFNSILVWEDMASTALEKKDMAKYKAHQSMSDDAYMELDQKYGIELPSTVYAYRRWFKREE